VDVFFHHIATGGAKLIPMIVSSGQQLIDYKTIFDKALQIRQKESDGIITEREAESLLDIIQSELDIKVSELYGFSYGRNLTVFLLLFQKF
jgi:hypothetical protein